MLLVWPSPVVCSPADRRHAAAPAVDAKPVAVVQADKPDAGKLIPHGVQGAQSHITLNDEQTANVEAIIAATKKAGLPERAAVISIATSLQESKLENLGHLGDPNDHDSLGLFQQRPSRLGYAGADHRPRVLHPGVREGPAARSTVGGTCR